MKAIIESLKKRKLTKREKVLLTIFSVIIILWLSYNLVLKDQITKIESLEVEKTILDNELSNVNLILEDELDKSIELSNLKTEIIDIGNSYFSELDQVQIIYYLEDLFLNNELVIKNLSFFEKEILTIDDLDVQYITLLIPFEGRIEDIKNVIKDLKSGPFKVNIESFFLNYFSKENLEGEVLLKIYCLENLIELPLNKLVLTPREPIEVVKDFNPLEEETLENKDVSVVKENNQIKSKSSGDSNYGDTSRENPEKKKNINNKLNLANFNNIKCEFVASHEMVNGDLNVFSENNNKYLRFNYHIQGINEEENRAYIDLSNGNLEFRYPIKKLYFTIKTYNYSYGSLGIRLRTPENKDIDLIICEGVNWVGWGNIEFSLPTNLSLYPLKLVNIFYEIPNNREDLGVLIFDKLEVQLENQDTEIHDFYMIEKNDTLDSISIKTYGSDKYVDEIININYLSSHHDIIAGQILILKRR